MKRTAMTKALSFVLTLIMVFVSYVAMPVKALADEAEEAAQSEAIAAYAAANDFSQGNELKYSPLTGELPEERNESMKVFRRADGAQEAVVYSDPIHYLKDETWETIDNTLELVTLEDGTQVYRNKANDFIVSFSPAFNADNLITVESKGHILSWRFAEGVLFAQEEPVKEEAEASEAEVPEEPEREEEQSVEESEDNESVEEPGEKQDDQETPSDESESIEVSEESGQEETETPVEAEGTSEEVEPEEPESSETEEPETEAETIEDPEAENEPAYETLKVTNTKAEVVVREQKEPETDEDRDMLLRFPEELTSELTYKDPETGLNVHYVLSGKRLSEQIVLDHAPENAVAYSTLLSTDGLKAEEKDGRIVFVDESGETIFEILSPIMYDANGEESAEIEVRLIETENGYAYTLIPDAKWLQDESRMYPVVVDPDIKPSFNGAATDTYITSSSPNSDYSGRDKIKIGGDNAYDGLVYFNISSLKNQLGTGDVVLEATINLSRYAQNSGGQYVKAYPIVKDWVIPQAYTWNAFYALGNPVNTDRAIALVGAAYGSDFNHFDVTDLTKKWIAGIQPNYGIYLDGSSYVEYRSSEYSDDSSKHPYFSLIYVNSTGLEGQYSYYSQNAGRAGTGSVNLFSGNLTWTHADASINNGVLPISLTHVYNTNDRSTNIGYGYGWRLNYSQSLKKVELTNRTETATYYQLIDGDGTRHYYKYSSANTYVNELDKNSTLKISGTTATIEDKGGNKLIFACDSGVNNGRLTTIQDANGNKTVITYTTTTITNLRISTIREELNGLSAGQQLTLTYSDNLLSEIDSPDGLDVSFTYSSSNLTKITYADDKSSTYTYSSHCLKTAKNIDNYNLNYTYTGSAPFRVTRVDEKANTTQGQFLEFTYEWNSTIVQDAQGRNTIYQFDNNGQAVGVRDAEGHAMYAAYNTGDRTVTQLSAVSKLQSTTINLLKNGHFARSADWTLGTGASYYGGYGYNGHRTMRLNASAVISQTVSVENGKSYTLSAAVCGGSGVYLQIVPTSGSIITLNSASEGIDQGDGWEKLSLGMKATYTGTVTVKVVNGGSAQAWVDYVQFEQSATPSRYNLVENSDWRNGTNQYYFNGNCGSSPSGLVDITGTAIDTTHPEILENHVYKIVGSSYNNYLYYNTQCNGKKGDTWTFGGWCYTEAPARTTQRIRDTSPYNQSYCNLYIRVRFLNSNHEDVGTATVPFITDLSQWQYACGSAVAPAAYSYIAVDGVFSLACNNTYFDGLQLYREEFSQAYTYDDEGNMTGYTSLIGQENTFEYNSTNDVTKSTDPRGNSTTYTYDTKHNMTSMTSPEGVKSKYTINAKGQVYKTQVGSDTKYIETTTEHGGAAALLTKVIDSRGKEVTYDYDSNTRQNTQITDPKGNTSTYLYGNALAMHRLASITSSGLGVVEYGYDPYGKLETITRGDTVYTLEYDSTWNLPVKTKVGSVALSTNTYDNQKRLSTVTYANGFSARYEYDNLDRVNQIYQTENNTESLVYEMIYNDEGDLYELRNYRTLRASFFEYDHAGRCMASKERSFTVSGGTISYGTILSSYSYQYDECNNLTKLTCSVAGSTWSTTYTYDKDNRSKTTTLNSGKVITNTYDEVGRLSKRSLGLSTMYNTVLTYIAGNGSNKTTALVGTYKNGSDAAYTYTYDDNGNITSITQGSTSITYEYDAANRLTRENNQVTNQTVTYEYDVWGNILNKKIYAYTTAGDLTGLTYTPVPYAYTDTSWGDQLTSYNGQTITYDSMGNPLTYRGYTFGWRGKQLTSASNGTDSLTFEYNEDGLRQKKTVNGVDTNYFYNGSVLIGMQRGTSKFLFSYDASGNVVSVNYNGTEYYYLRNAQGDIVKIIDTAGEPVVIYTYDTWGKKVSTTGSLAGSLGLFQPFRYRGYVYDYETGFYYLQSRYYDPTTGRFISADILLSTGQGVLGHNCYAYCLDNPVNGSDPSGLWFIWGGGGNKENSEDGSGGGYSSGTTLFVPRTWENPYKSTRESTYDSIEEYKYADGAAKSGENRPYYDSVFTQKDIIAEGTEIYEGNGVYKYSVTGSFNGSYGLWEIVVIPHMQLIGHFMFQSIKSK